MKYSFDRICRIESVEEKRSWQSAICTKLGSFEKYCLFGELQVHSVGAG